MAVGTLQASGDVEAQLAQLIQTLGGSVVSGGKTELLKALNAALATWTPQGNSLGVSVSGTTSETIPRTIAAQSVAIATGSSGDLFLFGVYLPVNTVVNAVNFVTGTTASVGVTHNWGVLANASRVVLGVSADNTSVDLVASTRQTYTLAAPVTITASGLYYIGQMVAVATTMPTMIGNTQAGTTLLNLAPILGGKSNTGATVPVAVGATLTAITVAAGVDYAFTS